MLKNVLHLLKLGTALMLVLAAAGLISGCARRSLPNKAESSVAKSCTVTLSPNDSIQQAIESAPSGAVICLGEGTWKENIEIVGKSLTLRGDEAGKTVIRSGERGRTVVWIEGDEIEVNLEGVTLTGASGVCSGLSERCAHGLVAKGSARVSLQGSTVSGNEWSGLWVGDSAQVSLQDSTVSDNIESGLDVWDSAQVSLQGSTVSGNGDGFSVYDSAQVSLQDSTVSDNFGGGFSVHDSAQVSLQDSTVSDNFGGGLDVWDSAQMSLTNCTVSDSDNGSGFSVHDSAQVSLTNCTVSDNKFGLAFGGSAQVSLQDCTVSGNNFGLWVWGSARVSLQGSTVSGNGRGLFAQDSAQVSLQDSTVSGNMDGLWVMDSARVEVRESCFLDNKRAGIAVWSEEAQVEGTSNEMRGNGADLCGYALPSLRKTLVPQTDRRQLTVPGDYATVQEAVDAVAPGGTITIAEGTYIGGITLWKPVTLRGAGREATTLQAQEGQGQVISILADVQGARLEKLAVRGSKFGGLLVYGQAHLEELQVSDNGWIGLLVEGSAQVSLQGSTVSDNGDDGLYVVDSARVSIEGGLIEDNGTADGCEEEWLCSGIAVGDEAQVEITNTTIRNNASWGIAALIKKCGYDKDDFEGTVLWEGRDNEIYDNSKGDVCLP